VSLSGYATAHETGSGLTLAKYEPRLPNWPEGLELKIAVIADIHARYPWMSGERIREIVDVANAQRRISPCCSATMSAPIRSFPVMCRQAPGSRGSKICWCDEPERTVLLADPIGRPAGAAAHARRSHGADDLTGAVREIRDAARAILLVHEPFFFPWVPDRIALTLAWPHARRAGQSSVPRGAGAPFSSAARRGSFMANTRKRMIVSGGLGTSYAPAPVLVRRKW
jgi:predicted MPP superfamily phosphohydrolase